MNSPKLLKEEKETRCERDFEKKNDKKIAVDNRRQPCSEFRGVFWQCIDKKYFRVGSGEASSETLCLF